MNQFTKIILSLRFFSFMLNASEIPNKNYLNHKNTICEIHLSHTRDVNQQLITNNQQHTAYQKQRDDQQLLNNQRDIAFQRHINNQYDINEKRYITHQQYLNYKKYLELQTLNNNKGPSSFNQYIENQQHINNQQQIAYQQHLAHQQDLDAQQCLDNQYYCDYQQHLAGQQLLNFAYQRDLSYSGVTDQQKTSTCRAISHDLKNNVMIVQPIKTGYEKNNTILESAENSTEILQILRSIPKEKLNDYDLDGHTIAHEFFRRKRDDCEPVLEAAKLGLDFTKPTVYPDRFPGTIIAIIVARNLQSAKKHPSYFNDTLKRLYLLWQIDNGASFDKQSSFNPFSVWQTLKHYDCLPDFIAMLPNQESVPNEYKTNNENSATAASK